MHDQVIKENPLNARLDSLLKIVPRGFRNIPLHSSTVRRSLLPRIRVANNRAVTARFESTSRRHHIRMNGHNFL